ncbi:MAG: DNA topoisomerase, partial [Clostridia bacterium]|nr:DNA topoisomerase [Clostridia bacterium]
PPTRYTEASLVKEMEENGIGRPATYAMIITTLNTRSYVSHEGKYLRPTELGSAVNEFLASNFKQVINVKFTADMESKLDEIADNGKDWKLVASSFWSSFSNLLTNASAGERIRIEPEKTDIVCDKCGAPMVVREGRYGKFLGCSAYPNCKNIMKLANQSQNGGESKFVSKVLGPCPQCGKDVVTRRTKTGKIYFACSGYPECKYASWTNPFKQ